MQSGIEQTVRQLTPPALWPLVIRLAGSRLGKALLASRQPRIIHTLAELDTALVQVAEAAKQSDDAMRQALSQFRFAMPANLPSDPASAAYHDAQMALYYQLSGRDSYEPQISEMTTFEMESHIKRPFPYSTRSSTTVGEQLMNIGFLIQALALQPDDRLLEFGPGYGKLTLELAQMDYAITAVDINPKFLQLIQARARARHCQVETVCADMLAYQPNKQFDKIIFYESFHHCANHIQLIKNLAHLLAPGGAIYFAGEPIADNFPMPWGIRLDGTSVWSIRSFGWLELGFQTRYFVNLLQQHGWQVSMQNVHGLPWQKLFVARRS